MTNPTKETTMITPLSVLKSLFRKPLAPRAAVEITDVNLNTLIQKFNFQRDDIAKLFIGGYIVTFEGDIWTVVTSEYFYDTFEFTVNPYPATLTEIRLKVKTKSLFPK
jgi:hypothetical protein